MATSEEDPLFRIAIHESVESKSKRPLPNKVTSEERVTNEEMEEDLNPRVTIDDMIVRLASCVRAELPGFEESEGDTWVFIDAAPKQPEQDQLDYEHYVKRCSEPIRLKKTTLMKLHSPVINSAFTPTFQYRLLRRRKLVDKLPEGVKYVVDLTPPNEGEDAVWLITSLSCSEGVRLWYHSQEVLAVSPKLVGGEEEYTSLGSNPKDDRSAPPSTFRRLTGRSKIAPEYSPIRHRAAIERLLAAAVGADPKLDSAPKLWTTFAVAKHLGIVHSPLTDYIVTWLRAYPNSSFLEILTETSHIMADQLEVYDLERDTFAMLVGEEALDSLVRSRGFQQENRFSTFGRKKENLPEHIKTRVEYASKAFIDRITEDFEELKRGGWIESLAEFQRLSSVTHPDLQSILVRLKSKLRYWVQGTIRHLQLSKYENIPGAAIPPSGGEDLIPRWDRNGVWESLAPSERILTRTFWNTLKDFDLFDGDSNLDLRSGWKHATFLAINREEPVLELHGYRKIRRPSLEGTIRVGQTLLDDLNLLDGQTKDFPSTEKRHGEEKLSPIKVAKRLPLAMRPKYELNPLPPLPDKFQVIEDNIFDKDSLGTQAATSDPDLPSFQHLCEASQEELFGTSNTWDEHFLKASNTPIHQSFKGNENNFLESEEDKENTLRDWDDPLQGDTPRDENTFDPFDTTSLLGQTEKLARSKDDVSKRVSMDVKQGMKRSAETQRPELSSTTARDVTTTSFLFHPKKLKTPKRPVFFNLSKFFEEAEDHIRMVARLKLSYTDTLNGRSDPHNVELLNTLVCLDDPEFKYLPLWAGGCDDETGGVFNDEVSMPDVSFGTAGPSIQHGPAMHTVSECDTISNNGIPRGIATPTSSGPSSEYHLVNDAASTITPSSNNTTAGYFSDILASDQVYAASSVEEDESDSRDEFSVIARSDGMNFDDEEENARREIEIRERIEAAEKGAAGAAEYARTAPESDENYADLWGSEDGDDEDDGGNDSDDTMQGLDDCDDDDDNGECGSEGELV